MTNRKKLIITLSAISGCLVAYSAYQKYITFIKENENKSLAPDYIDDDMFDIIDKDIEKEFDLEEKVKTR